jgi:hypothetical protein
MTVTALMIVTAISVLPMQAVSVFPVLVPVSVTVMIIQAAVMTIVIAVIVIAVKIMVSIVPFVMVSEVMAVVMTCVMTGTVVFRVRIAMISTVQGYRIMCIPCLDSGGQPEGQA